MNNPDFRVIITSVPEPVLKFGLNCTKELPMQTGLLIFGALIFWFILNKWLLPKMGVPT
ncbi:hypothetical protein SBDP1_920012 [Syntrophobacter sp. SbD1]|nr:hypothetical protein SBDP1_920012 [Syntrophobacter sp. SbD1]